MTTATLFKSDRTQAMRPPKAVAFPLDARKVEIPVVGEALIIATNNRREFDRMPGLRVEDWLTAASA